MFHDDEAFDGDISKWDVSRVINMLDMFYNAKAFNGDISKWDVSSVANMRGMFCQATAFNGDISNWDVSSVTNMDRMFFRAESFKQKLCGAAWVNSKATKTITFAGTSGSISDTVCTSVPTPVATLTTRQYRPLSERELI